MLWLKWNTSICALYTRDVYYIGVRVEVFELTLTEHFVVLDLSSCSSRRVQLKQAGVLLSLFASFGPFWAIGAPFLWSAEFGPRPVVPILQTLCLSLFLMTHSLGSLPASYPPSGSQEKLMDGPHLWSCCNQQGSIKTGSLNCCWASGTQFVSNYWK